MKIGLIGLPNSGKTTVFNALTRNNVLTGSYASPLGEHHLGQVTVPDPRFDVLVRMFEPRKNVAAVVDFVDLAGIAAGSARGGGVNKDMLGFIRDVDALVHVVRAFEDPGVPHPAESVDAGRDILVLETELILNDLMVVEARLERLEKEILRLPKEKRLPLAHEQAVLEKFRAHLEAERPLRILDVPADDLKVVRGYAFLSLQPLMVLVNVGESDLGRVEELALALAPPGLLTLAAGGKVEAELGQLSPEDAAAFMAEMGIAESGLDRVIRAAYDLLGLQSFFTVGKDEVRAWTIRKGSTALAAAGRIHSDLARGFIRAEVVGYDDLMRAGSWNKAKEQALLRLEGKEYVVRDGDILSIRFNI